MVLLRNGLLLPIAGFASCAAALIYMSFGGLGFHLSSSKASFVGREGTHFMADGRALYVNGWNSYWLMDHAVDEGSRHRVSGIFGRASEMGLSVCRTWAFNDGAYNALQVSLGLFDERVFKALDHVIAKAREHGVRLLLSLSNNLQAYGGKTQYVKWAWEEGIGSSSSNDSFFFDPVIRSYFRAYLKTILTRKNHLTGIEYRDDPTIFAWELMNEPRCVSDPSGDTLQDWIEEMAAYVKSIDKNHLVTIGLEGFYGPTSPPEKLAVNPGELFAALGSDFIRNSKISAIDFASVHMYPDQWLGRADIGEKMEYTKRWVASHIEDGDRDLSKPVLFTEFGLSNAIEDFDYAHREKLYGLVFDTMYLSAMRKRAGAGAFIWQLMAEGMEEFNDDFGIVPAEMPAVSGLITRQSCRLAKLQHGRRDGRGGDPTRELC